MDPVANPFAPGAGAPPPELAGREELLETVRIAIERVRMGGPAFTVPFFDEFMLRIIPGTDWRD